MNSNLVVVNELQPDAAHIFRWFISIELRTLTVYHCLFQYRHTHELKLHQLLVRVCGWEQVKPVSVDKVGIFFRYAAPDRSTSSNTVSATQKQNSY